MSRIKVSFKRLLQHIHPVNINYTKFSPGFVLTPIEYRTCSFTKPNGAEQSNDEIIALDELGWIIKIPVKDYLKMHINNNQCGMIGGVSKEEGNDEVLLPRKITIISSTDRQYRVGNNHDSCIALYPNPAYQLVQKYYEQEITKHAMIMGGLKSDNSFCPIQDYIIKIEV